MNKWVQRAVTEQHILHMLLLLFLLLRIFLNGIKYDLCEFPFHRAFNVIVLNFHKL